MPTDPKQKKGNIINDAIIKDIAGIVTSLRFGEIVIKVHDSKIVQVATTKKARYEEFHMEQGSGI